jgi:hypothetical protein
MKKVINNKYVLVFWGMLASLLFFVFFSKGIKSAPDYSEEESEIREQIEIAYWVMAEARSTQNLKLLETVFVNTDDYPFTQQEVENFGQRLGGLLPEKPGYLTALQAKYFGENSNLAMLQKYSQQAKAENRDLTASEIDEILSNGQGLPPVIYTKQGNTQFQYFSFEIDADRAIVHYDDGAAEQEAILVKINDIWYISAIKVIKIHF